MRSLNFPNDRERVAAAYAYDALNGESMALNYNDLLTAPATTVYNRLGLPATIGDGTGTRTLQCCAPYGVVRAADLAEEEAELADEAASLWLTADDDDDRNHS